MIKTYKLMADILEELEVTKAELKELKAVAAQLGEELIKEQEKR